MNRLVASTIVIVVSLFAAGGHTEEPNKVAAFMRLKLSHSQKLLEGIVLKDFKLIAKSAQDLSLLSQDERWQVFQTPEYLQLSIEFRRSADAVAESAGKNNLDGAALAYVGMTLQCVNCHQHLRDVRMAGRSEELPHLVGNR